MQDLKDNGLYYDRPANELVFLTHGEHIHLHRINRSEKTREKMSKAMKGVPKSDEMKRKMSEAMKGNTNFLGHHHSEKARAKMRSAKNGIHWFNDGKKSIMAKECPSGFVHGRLRK